MITKCIDAVTVSRDAAKDIHRVVESIRDSIKHTQFDIEALVLICALLDKADEAAASINDGEFRQADI